MKSLLLHLSLIPHIGPLTSKRVLEFLSKNGLDEAWVYCATVKELCMIGLSPSQAQLIVDGLRDTHSLKEEVRLSSKYDITIVVEQDVVYPSWLRSIHAPPSVLYVQGNINALCTHKHVAMVGSRQANAYGRSVLDMLVPIAVDAGWTVVSGGARGIDAYAHRTTLQHGGTTIAVLGSGLLRPYPAENESLFKEIVEKGGAVISSFPLCMTALPGNFPARNRIIAGMSQSCVVVQAAKKSGALITASYALAEGRDVGVVPGSIFDPLSAGCHSLLRDGAAPIVSPDEFKLFLGEEASSTSVQCAIPMDTSDPVCQKQLMTACIGDDPIVQACMKKSCSFEELLPYTAGVPDELHNRLWDLQLQGKISQTVTGLWQASA